MKNLDGFSKALFVIIIIAIICAMIILNSKDEREYNLKMAQAGLEQCKPHWMNKDIIWVKSCKEIMEK